MWVPLGGFLKWGASPKSSSNFFLGFSIWPSSYWAVPIPGPWQGLLRWSRAAQGRAVRRDDRSSENCQDPLRRWRVAMALWRHFEWVGFWHFPVFLSCLVLYIYIYIIQYVLSYVCMIQLHNYLYVYEILGMEYYKTYKQHTIDVYIYITHFF
jgi:hypothetical protein